jgi:lauroyl/myristoyl acyltransferase
MVLARAEFDQASRVSFAVAHPGLFRALGKLPAGPLHGALRGLTWLETWLRYPLKTLRIQDSLEERLSVLDPQGQRFGLTPSVRTAYRRNFLHLQVPDLIVLLTHLESARFRRRGLLLDNEQTLLQERERGPGAIVVGFRIGAYPAVPWVLGTLGHPVTMIVGDGSFVEMGESLGERFVSRLNARVRFVSAQDPRVLARCLETLNAGGIVGTLLELPPVKFERTTDVEFLGWNIQVPYGIAYLAAATGRSIVPAALTREDGPRFRLRFGEAVPAPSRDRASIFAATQKLYEALEGRVRQFPEQWAGWTLLEHMGVRLETKPGAVAPALS